MYPADNNEENDMGNAINWLITILYGDTLLRCALQVRRDSLPGDCAMYPMEPENRRFIHTLLPTHVQSCGQIVEVENLFEVHVADAGQRETLKSAAGSEQAREFTTAEVIVAIRDFLKYGGDQYGVSQQGYFSGGGFAAAALRYHLDVLSGVRKGGG